MAHLLSLAGWTILPNLVTGWAQSLWYGISIRAGDPKPVPGSPQFNQHRRRIYIIVVSAYLLYTIYEADWDIRKASDFYQDLAVPHTVSDRELKSRFRRLAAIHHPDKVSSGAPNTDGYFVHLKLAQDTLLNPAKRYAYERFGPGMLGWQRCSSIGDYVYQGVQSVIPYYGATAIFMYLLGLFGYLEWGKYWRWLALIVLCTFELSVISRPHFPPIAAKLINPLLTAFTSHPPYLPFQLIQLFRKMSITLSIALGQIGPLLQPPTATPAGVSPETALRQQLDRLEQSANMANNQASILMQMEMSPFQHDVHDMNKVKGKISEWLANNTINQDPEVRDAVGTVMKKRRTDAPAGARGNR